LGLAPLGVPREWALGAVVAHLQNTQTPDFQPSNVTWAPFPHLENSVRDKRERRRSMAQRALRALEAFQRELAPRGAGVKPSPAPAGRAPLV